MIDKEVKHTNSLSRQIGDKNNKATMTLSLHPCPDCPTFKQVKTVQDKDGQHVHVGKRQLQAINSGVASALKYGR